MFSKLDIRLQAMSGDKHPQKRYRTKRLGKGINKGCVYFIVQSAAIFYNERIKRKSTHARGIAEFISKRNSLRIKRLGVRIFFKRTKRFGKKYKEVYKKSRYSISNVI
jgi:hypothetical protein